MLLQALTAGKEHPMARQDLTTLDELVGAFFAHERRTRGLREQTLQNYGRVARRLVGETLGRKRVDVAALGPDDVRQFVEKMTSSYSARSMKAVGTALRAFFRFLRVEGVCEEPLEMAIPSMPSWRRTTLPQYLSDEQLRTLLASCDNSAPCGHRDRAMITCLSRLGLRPGEVAGLCLGDIDWRSGTVVLTTRKTRRGAVLPLPHDAGQAIVDYLRRERPTTDERYIFVQHLGRCAGRRITGGNLAMMPTEGESRKEETRSPRREGLVNHPETNCQRATEPAAA
jgi:integrase/recombinase XerD